MKAGGEVVRDALQTSGLDGSAFQGAGGGRIELLHASRDAESPPGSAAENEYIVVLEGRYELSLGGGTIVLERGMEFAFPQGVEFSGKVKAGTRVVRASLASTRRE